MMQKIGLSLLLLVGLANLGYAQGTQVLSYGYPINNYYYSTPVVPGVVQYQHVVTGVIVDSTPRVTVIAPILPVVPVAPIVHPVPVVIQPVGPVVRRCWWPSNYVYNYGY